MYYILFNTLEDKTMEDVKNCIKTLDSRLQQLIAWRDSGEFTGDRYTILCADIDMIDKAIDILARVSD